MTWWKILLIKKAAPVRATANSSKEDTLSNKTSFRSFITQLIKLVITLAILVVLYLTLYKYFLKLEIFKNWELKDISGVTVSLLTIGSTFVSK